MRKGGTSCSRRSTERWSRSFKRNPAGRSTWGAQRRALVAMPMMRNSDPPAQFLIRAGVARRNSARRSYRKGVRGSRQPTSADPPHPPCNIAGERERSHDARHRRLGELRGRRQCAFRNPITAITRQSPQASGSAPWPAGYVRSSITNRFEEAMMVSATRQIARGQRDSSAITESAQAEVRPLGSLEHLFWLLISITLFTLR